MLTATQVQLEEDQGKMNAERELLREALSLCQAEVDAVQEELAAAHVQLRLGSIPEEEESQGGAVHGTVGDARKKCGACGGGGGPEPVAAGAGDAAKILELSRVNRELVALNEELRKEALLAAKRAASEVGTSALPRCDVLGHLRCKGCIGCVLAAR